MSVVITGLKKTEELLDKLTHIEKPMKELARELCELAERVVNERYGSYYVFYDGNTDYSTEIEELPNGFRLTAYGEDIGFLEFGTGIFASPDEFAGDFGVYPGSWSETHAKQFNLQTHPYWYWRGQKTAGMPPTRGMHEALETIQNEFNAMAKEKIEAWIHGS